MFISKKANLISDITREIVTQYAQQLKQSIEDNRNANISEYQYENRVIRAEKALIEVEQILQHFDESMLNGYVNDDGTITLKTGVNKTETIDNDWHNKSREEVENLIACSRARTMFRAIGIKPTSIEEKSGIPTILLRKMAKLDGTYEKYKDMGEFQYAKFPEKSKIDFGELNINNQLAYNMTAMEDGTLTPIRKYNEDGTVAIQLKINGLDKHKLSGRSRVTSMYYGQERKFIVDADKIDNLIDEYLKIEFSKTNGTSDKKSEIARDLFTTLSYGLDDSIGYKEVRYKAEDLKLLKDEDELEL